LIFRKSKGINIAIFWSKCDSIPYRIVLEKPAISAKGHRMGFTPLRVRSGKCGGVYISVNPEEFTSSTPNIGAKNLKSKSNQHRILYKK